MMPRFEIHQPTSVDEASELLLEYGDDARAYAGGVALILAMKEGFIDCNHLVDLKRIPGFDAIEADGVLRIGAGATHRQIERSPRVRERFPALADAEHLVGNIRVRTTGTLGGNLCFAEPDSDPGVLLLAQNATVRLERAGGQRQMSLDEFFIGALEVALQPGELLTVVEVPPVPPATGVSYQRFGVLERPLASVAAIVSVDGADGPMRDVRLVAGCVGARPRRLREAEALLNGASPRDSARLGQAADVASRSVDALDDHRASAAYRRHLVGVLTRRAVNEAVARAS